MNAKALFVRKKPLYVVISSVLQALRNCEAKQSSDWMRTHKERLSKLNDLLPSGCGFDNGSKLDLELSQPQKLVFNTSFHHMHDTGVYDGWTEHTVTVTPVFGGFDLKIGGRNRNDIKEYIGEVFHSTLCEEIEEF